MTHVGISEENYGEPTQSSSSAQLQEPTGKPLEKMSAMRQGDGDDSYSKNSEYQAHMNVKASLSLTDALERVTLPSEGGGPLVVAELGSSSGPNAITKVALIIDSLKPRFQTYKRVPDFQVFFNDLPSNDFNNLFQLWSSDERAKNIYCAGVPGSFYGRLFPDSSVHVFNSDNSLQWLSKVPEAVLDKDSPAYNRGNAWIQHSQPAPARAFQQQALQDLKDFLMARAAELAPGGVLFFSTFGRSTSEPNEPTLDYYYHGAGDLTEAMRSLVAEGILTEDQLDTFNIPFYVRSIADVEEAIASYDSSFDVLSTKLHTEMVHPSQVYGGSTDMTILAQKLVGALRAVMGNLVEAKVGKEIAELVWQRHEKSCMKWFMTTTKDDIQWAIRVCVVSLIRK